MEDLAGPVPSVPPAPPATGGSGPTRAELHQARRAAHRAARRAGRPSWRRPLVGMAALAVVVVLVVVLVAVTAGPGEEAPAAPATASVHATLSTRRQVPGADPASLPWPTTGQAAVAIPAVGYTAQSGGETPVPVASMTKVMTAYVVLQDHPLVGTASGPDITITPSDAADYTTDVVTTQASVAVQAGEVLTERQALQGMLVHSANNLAYALGCWDAGSLAAFVQKMNTTAASLGMHHTHYVDASGYTPGSASTAADLLKVATAAMAIPFFAQTVTMPSVTLPVAGTVSTYTPLLPGSTTSPTPGVVGVKSGFTSAAGGGDILAYETTVGGHSVEVLAAVTTQEGPTVLHNAGEMDLAVARAAAADLVSVDVAAAGQRVGTVSEPGARVAAVAGTSASLLAWPGQTVRQEVVAGAHLPAGAPAGTTVGTAQYHLGSQEVSVPVRTARRLPGRR